MDDYSRMSLQELEIFRDHLESARNGFLQMISGGVDPCAEETLLEYEQRITAVDAEIAKRKVEEREFHRKTLQSAIDVITELEAITDNRLYSEMSNERFEARLAHLRDLQKNLERMRKDLLGE